MTRLDKQIQEKQNELDLLKSFASEKMQMFNSDLQKIVKVLKKYKVTEYGTDNCFVDKSIIDEKKLIFRMYLSVSLQLLSHKQRKNIEKQLRDLNIPMPICPIDLRSIELVYHD